MRTPTDNLVDQTFDILRHSSRRRILMRLYHHSGPGKASIDPTDFIPEDANQEQIQSELYHTHLPRLDDSGFVDWDRHRDLIMRGPQFEELYPFLDLLEESEDRSFSIDG